MTSVRISLTHQSSSDCVKSNRRECECSFLVHVIAAFHEIDEPVWLQYKQTFSLACLLHDCAHAPFSHALESYYDYTPTSKISRLNDRLLKAANDEVFVRDYTDRASSHEKASAILVLEYFAPKIRRLGGDPLLAARMILGYSNLDPAGEEKRLENCLISLLNGKAVDVDKLDYILRDTWASGINNTSIDTHRLLSALSYDSTMHRLAFRKSGLSVLQSVVDGRNHLHRWVFGHHKVIYNQYLLKTSIEKLTRVLSPSDDPDRFLQNAFSLDTFYKDVEVGKGISLYLPTDHDLTVLLKKYRNEIPEAQEYLFRRHARKALWKTSAEFYCLFSRKNADELELIREKAADLLKDEVGSASAGIGFVAERIPARFAVIRTGDILIQMNGTTYSYDQLFDKPPVPDPGNPFYVYAPLDCERSHRPKLIRALQAVSI